MSEDNGQQILSDIEQLEAEGDFAADYIEGLLDLADLDGDLNLSVKNDRAYVSVTAEGDDLEVFARAETVQALQTLTRLAVQRKTGNYSGLILDIGGSRAARAEELKQIADHAIVAINAGQAEVVLESLTSYERKIVHDYVADQGFHSESRGEGSARRLVVSASA